MDNFWDYFFVSFPKKSILRSVNITALDAIMVLLLLEVRIPLTILKLVMLCYIFLSMFVFTDGFICSLF